MSEASDAAAPVVIALCRARAARPQPQNLASLDHVNLSVGHVLFAVRQNV